jgi:hypothetical protein
MAADPKAGAEVAWKCGNEFTPFHPQASHVDPSYRDGWNHCHAAATSLIAELQRELAEAKRDAERWRWIEDNATSHGGGNGFTLQVFVPHDMEDWGCAIDAARSMAEGSAGK